MATLSDHTERTALTRFGVVASRFHEEVCKDLLTGCIARLEEAGIASNEIEVVRVPGAFDIPFACQALANQGSFVALVALGCVVRGETTHYETVCNDSSRALTMLGLQGLCVGNGILTVENMDQATVRAEAKGQNKGGGAAAAALHLIALTRKWGASRNGVGFRPSDDAYQLASD